jgi:phospholipid/cholesterol/gamma-HCH transport system ATP-binding protein
LRTILGLKRPDGGTIEVFGHRPEQLSAEAQRSLQRRWGVLFQNGALFSSLTVAQNIQVPLREHLDLPQHLLDGIAAMKIAIVGLPPDAARLYPSELSGGMRKRAGLARALALDPELIFLDEPTAGLDPISAAEFDRLIANLQRSMRLTVFMVTHDIDSLKAITDRIAVLVDKRTRVGTMDELLRDEHPWIRAYFHGPRGRAAIPSAQGEA